MSATGFSLRLGRPEELDAIVAIDDGAALLYQTAGLEMSLAAEHPFVLAEVMRWAQAITESRLHVAVDASDMPVGFASWKRVDALPYLDQLSVLPTWMRRGIGAALMRRVIEDAGDAPLWLTTYDHLAWNRPYYEQFGFTRVPEERCGEELCAILAKQRDALPAPEMRCAMLRQPDSP